MLRWLREKLFARCRRRVPRAPVRLQHELEEPTVLPFPASAVHSEPQVELTPFQSKWRQRDALRAFGELVREMYAGEFRGDGEGI
jgi:hypothetical protein